MPIIYIFGSSALNIVRDASFYYFSKGVYFAILIMTLEILDFNLKYVLDINILVFSYFILTSSSIIVLIIDKIITLKCQLKDYKTY